MISRFFARRAEKAERRHDENVRFLLSLADDLQEKGQWEADKLRRIADDYMALSAHDEEDR